MESAVAVTWETSTIEPGLRVVTTPIPTTQAAAVSLFVGVGSRAEEPRLNGITHFLEHMVFKGTQRRPSAIEIAAEIEGAGGTLNAYTTKEYTCYWNIVPFDRLPTAIDVVADMLRGSLLDVAEIAREKTVVHQELKRTHDNPAAWAARLIGGSIFGSQPCGWDVGGTVDLVSSMTRDDFVGHMSTWYTASNMVLSVAGNLSHDAVLELVSAHFSGLPDPPLPAVAAYDPATRGERIAVDSREIDQCTLFIGLPAFGRTDRDRFALRIMNDILGSGMSSRLFREVRERRGLAYSVGSGYGHLSDTGSFTVSAGVEPQNLDETIRVCVHELEQMAAEPVSDDELTRAREHTIGRFRLALETASSLGQRHGEQLLTRGEIETIEDHVAALGAVTVKDVQGVAKRLLAARPYHVSVVGPGANEDRIEAALGGP